jgi:MtrB/PioB family decaheme-associated outer membrane protein
MKTKRFSLAFLSSAVILLAVVPGYTQIVTTANATLGARQFSGTLNSSKFTEYRELPSGLFMNVFSVNFMKEDYRNFLLLWGSHVGQRDQNIAAQMGVQGSFKLELEWDQTPHNYTNTARTVFSGTGSGELVMPALVRNRIRTIQATDINPGVPGVQFDTAAVSSLILGTARGVEMMSRRDRGKIALSYSPTERVDINLQYTNERRSGTKPLGGNFSFNPIELVEPTDYRTHEALASVEYARKNWNLQLGYSASIFKNNVDVLVWDNPFREVDAVGAGSRGRLDLYPDNTAQKVSFSGAANLPFSTRFMTSVSYGWRKQDDPFIPYTINTALTTAANFPTLPAQSLNGKVGTTLINLSLVNRFFSSVWFTARFRSFNYDNQSPSLIFPSYVQTDNSITNVQRGNVPIGYKKTNALVDATLRFVSHLSLKLGYERENWDRENRDAEKTHEDIYKASLDYTPRSWLLLRTSYSFGAKKTPHYDWEEVAHVAFPAGEPAGTLGQLPQLRKFDMATRDRNRANILAQVTPSDVLAFTGSFGLANDDFKESLYGLLWSKSNTFSVDVSYNPTSDLALFASYTRENFKYATKSRQRVPQVGTTRANDTTNNDWSSDLEDLVNTFGFGFSWSVVPEQVDFSLDFSLSDGRGTIATRALGNPADPRFLVTSAQNYPDTRSILRQMRASVGYKLTDHFTPRLEYRFEGYSESYFNQDVMEPYMVPVDPASSGGVFLGARQPRYSAHMIYLVLSYNL